MRIPGLDDMLKEFRENTETMQATLDEIKDLMIQIEINTRPVDKTE